MFTIASHTLEAAAGAMKRRGEFDYTSVSALMAQFRLQSRDSHSSAALERQQSVLLEITGLARYTAVRHL